ncbi:hypothetical protein [Mycobacterium sp. 1423905.2]|uniref:hypothetical protein n=1 Tax=Mycobacterium sp. 1423905.2 TaxID=1856859 RepID=UPI0012E99A00|nr:hypothetical protein [Mycobacterium sp. 1423905.2]
MEAYQRQRRLGLAIGAVLLILGAVLATILFAVAAKRVLSRVPTDVEVFSEGQRSMLRVRAGETKSIYAKGAAGQDVRCSVFAAPLPTPDLSPDDFPLRPTPWRAVYHFTPAAEGNYAVSCTGPADARYAVGQYVAAEQFTAPLVGIAAGAVLVIAGTVVLVRTALQKPTDRAAKEPQPQPTSPPPTPDPPSQDP